MKIQRGVWKKMLVFLSQLCVKFDARIKQGNIIKGKHKGSPRNTSKGQDRKLRAICLGN